MTDLLEELRATEKLDDLSPGDCCDMIDMDDGSVAQLLSDAPESGLEPEIEPVSLMGGQFNTVSWNLPASGIWRLAVNNVPIVANYVSFTITNLRWKAGGGWPWYTTPCPRGGRAGRGFWQPGSPPHATCLVVGNRAFTNCHMSGWARGVGRSHVLFGVNDDKYDDNSGGFRLQLNSWS